MFSALFANPLMLIGVLLAALAAFGGTYFYGHHTGYATGKNEVQVKWDAETLKRSSEDKTKRDEDRDKGFALAAEIENEHHELEIKYARTSKALATALQSRVECPSSGVVGDVVLPAAVVRSMFNRDSTTEPVPTRPSASQPH